MVDEAPPPNLMLPASAAPSALRGANGPKDKRPQHVQRMETARDCFLVEAAGIEVHNGCVLREL